MRLKANWCRRTCSVTSLPIWRSVAKRSSARWSAYKKARDEKHALELANGTEYGLSSSIFSGNIERGVRFAQGIKAGMTHVNDMPVNDEAHVPFGGEKNSGLGRFNGDWAIEEFTTDHWISVQQTPRHYPF
ncbi:hypothetical protein HSBAA_61430 [Vreelandella sulfidaeris]|uniref:Aldehyde dehydrogenase domain-containing protein n=1 Tax=Vreelandella sulfidaeris TaxID=115553 RepID=A0A455UGI5_9GAMM|nr:hypothetical protein HSBAA_61430 [Halomonas sulfidaeris]